MALSQADLEYYRRVLNKLSMTAWGDFQKSFADLPQWEAVSAKRALSGAWPELIDYYGNIAATFGADNVEEWAESMGIKPVVKMVDGVDPVRATARAEWALSTADPMGNFKVLVDELVKQPYRSTVHNSAAASGVGWARVPTGSETCSFCLMLASRGGEYRSKKSAQFGSKGKKYHGECVVEGTLVHGPAAKVALRREYDGEVVVVCTSGGHDLTVTPNHPVLTRRGWVAAGLLHEGDDLLAAGAGQGHVVGGPDEDDAPARVEDRFRALGVMGASVAGSVPGAPEQFHGDGRDSEVEVVARDGLLWDEVQASFRQPLAEPDLALGAVNEPGDGLPFDGLGARVIGGGAPRCATHGGMGSRGLLSALGGGHLRGADDASTRPVADWLPGLSEPPAHDSPGDAAGPGEGQLALPGAISGGDAFGHIERTRTVRSVSVTAIVRKSYSGHVYNLVTGDGWYFANSIVTHNCDCTPVLIRDESDYPEGYDPDALYDVYDAAVAAAGGSRAGNTSEILAQMRVITGHSH